MQEAEGPLILEAARCVSFRELARYPAALMNDIEKDGKSFAISRYGRIVALLIPLPERLIIEFDEGRPAQAACKGDPDIEEPDLSDLARQFIIDAASTPTGNWNAPGSAITADRKAFFKALFELDSNRLLDDGRITKKGRVVAKALRARGLTGYDEMRHRGIIAFMSSQRIYTLPVEQTGWAVNGSFETVFNWEYDEMRDRLVTLYSKGKQKQWDAEVRIDWSQDLDPENPMELADEYLGIYGTDLWNRMTPKERTELRHHGQAWQISQFLHGEQGALICAAKIVETVPDIDSKFYAATQVIDEARHVEVYSRFLHQKFELAYPITEPLKEMLEQVIRDSRWDFTYLGMQVLIEGLALAAFGLIRDFSQNPLASAINAYVMQDEARHVAFGRLSLKDYYPQLTQKERDEREDFVVEASFLMRDRFRAEEVWRRLGYPDEDFREYVDNAPIMVEFRKLLFSRIVPTIKDIGLWGPKVQRAYAEMGVIDFQAIDPEEASAADERFADELDARKSEIDQTIAAGAD